MTVGVIAHIRIRAGEEKRFEAVIARHAVIVGRDEPGNRLYRLFRWREDPRLYTFMEIYDSDAALAAHRAMTIFDAGRAEIAALRDGEPELIVLDGVAAVATDEAARSGIDVGSRAG